MNMVRVQEQDVRQNAREEGIESEDEIKLVTVERNGAISIIKEKTYKPRQQFRRALRLALV